MFATLPDYIAKALISRLSRFTMTTTILSCAFGIILWIIRTFAENENYDAIITIIFGVMVIVIGICVWMFLLVAESQSKARDETEQQTDRLLQEIKAHERTDRALQEAKEIAEAASLAKSRYMSGLSHELRTPLNSIYGFAQLLEKDKNLVPWHQSLTSIRRSSEHLAGLIEGLLDISRIEAGRLEVMRDQINPHILFNQVTSIFEPEAKAKGIGFSLKIHGGLPKLVATDEKRLRQIIINLLSNAIRYTNSGQVIMDVSYRSEIALIKITDTGQGISSENLQKIWRPFERAGQKGQHGSGLGLTITKLLVEVLGGEITVDSQLGKGSIFSVKLMLPSLALNTFDINYLEQAEVQPEFSGYKGELKTVMVLDDDTYHLSLTEQFLTKLGFDVLLASTADMAHQILDHSRPDIILLDIDLPQQDGWSFADNLRNSPIKSVPIIVISGHANEERSLRSKMSLHDAFLAKPYNVDDLLIKIAELLKISLIFEQNPLKSESNFEYLPQQERVKLIESARIGHAAGLLHQLSYLKKNGNYAPDLFQSLEQRLQELDMKGFINVLEENEHASK